MLAPLICPCGCGRTFEPVIRGAHVKQFATTACKTRFESVARAYGMLLVETGLQTVAGMAAAVEAHKARISPRATAGREETGLEAAE